MAQNQATPLVLNNGVYLQSTEWETGSGHLDQSHLMYLNRSEGPVTDLGIVQPFVTAGYIMKPYLYSFSGMGKNRKYITGHIYKWSNPIHDEPCFIIEDLSNTDKPGIAGEKFRLKVSSNKYDNGYIIGIDQHSPDQLMITNDPIIPDGDGFIITVKYMGLGQNERYFPKEYLRPNTKLFPITTIGTEYQQEYSSIPTLSGGMREYFNTVGTTTAQLHYSITRDAYYSHINNKIVETVKNYRKIVEMYVFKPGSLGYDLSLHGQHSGEMKAKSMQTAYRNKYGADGMKQMKYDIAGRSWVPEIELTGMAWLEAMVEQEAIWGSGGLVDFDGRTKAQRSVGLFHQLNMGPTHSYDLFNFSLEKFEYIIANRLQGRVRDSASTVITIKTGRGGLAMIQNWLRNIPGQNGMITHSKDYIGNLGSQDQIWKPGEFKGWRMRSGLGELRFELAEGLDPHDANPQINPIVPNSIAIGGARLSSYMFIIDDITNGLDGGNIVELLYGPDWDFTKRHISGKLDYMGSKNFRSASHHPGFEVFLEKRHKAYWVKDPTKSLLIKPYNPFTGRPVYSSYHG